MTYGYLSARRTTITWKYLYFKNDSCLFFFGHSPIVFGIREKYLMPFGIANDELKIIFGRTASLAAPHDAVGCSRRTPGGGATVPASWWIQTRKKKKYGNSRMPVYGSFSILRRRSTPTEWAEKKHYYIMYNRRREREKINKYNGQEGSSLGLPENKERERRKKKLRKPNQTSSTGTVYHNIISWCMTSQRDATPGEPGERRRTENFNSITFHIVIRE